ncbi:hypothetical protein SYJ56_22620 [Algoriphagus sp. D3-2-R+10]|uniref:hypothetical protein n=1 Tax=Algoriphagus aurantiacus TaxID=3103948 RepID=UPI002B3872B2|nr:hypothetical protein [Algoriphagus sp. D3-2-R+10]MEB2778124.1 hypothetical protein [Algoriphagus sp. D3-2-R+10]
MENKIHLRGLLLLLFAFSANYCAMAQQYNWLKGGGSTSHLNNGKYKGEWVIQLCTDDNQNLYCLSVVGQSI